MPSISKDYLLTFFYLSSKTQTSKDFIRILRLESKFKKYIIVKLKNNDKVLDMCLKNEKV